VRDERRTGFLAQSQDFKLSQNKRLSVAKAY
jgi:hypothetical protein